MLLQKGIWWRFLLKIKKKNHNKKGDSCTVNFKNIQKHIIQNALSKNDFFCFNNLKTYLPLLESKSNFIKNEKFLGSLSIVFQGISEEKEIKNSDFLYGVNKLLSEVEKQIRQNYSRYKGTTEFYRKEIKEVIQDGKEIKITREQKNGESLYEEKDFYVFRQFYGTKEEKSFCNFFDDTLAAEIKEAQFIPYLVRNERVIKIYGFKNGQGFCPDYLLFLENKQKENNWIFQVFIEPKGNHLVKGEIWKEEFLKAIQSKYQSHNTIFAKKYKLIGLPFYNQNKENDFKKEFDLILTKKGKNK